MKNAWISDDAYISFRTVDNFLAGHGLVYNVGERVQSFTHPLWMFVLASLRAIFGELYYSTILLSLLLSLLSVYLIMKRATRGVVIVLVFAMLIFSKAFVDYTSSGLENPLSYLLLPAFIIIRARERNDEKDLTLSCLAAALIALCRLDTLLLTLPLLIFRAWKIKTSKAIVGFLAGFSPLVVWTVFSLFYYGAPVTNTAYAKLNTGIPAGTLIIQGLWYFVDSLQRDPVTLVIIAAGVLCGVVGRSPTRTCLSIGITLYLLFITKVGGDFMSGRFFTLPLIVAAYLIVDFARSVPAKRVAIAIAVIAALSIVSLRSNLLSGSGYGDVTTVPPEVSGSVPPSLINEHGICDERAAYFQATGLLRRTPGSMPTTKWSTLGLRARVTGPRVREAARLGIYGYYAGPSVHLVDVFALSDFLLARLPIPREEPFRIGHFRRVVPEGYLESISTGENRFADAGLGELYEIVSLIIKAPLFSEGRWEAIWKMNTGGYDHLIGSYADRRFPTN